MFTRFQALRLGKNGGLGFCYEKIVLLDADIMPICRYDELFKLDTPAGIINEKKEYFLCSESYNRDDGKSIWHEVYEDICRHGDPIPRDITTRVWYDSTNMGVNACIWVLKPDKNEFDIIVDSL